MSASLVERLRDADANSQQRILGSRIFGEAADAIDRLARELAEVRALLKDPAAVRVNYLRGDLACQNLIDEARRQAFEEAARIIRARMPLYTEPQALNACRECISSIDAAM